MNKVIKSFLTLYGYKYFNSMTKKMFITHVYDPYNIYDIYTPINSINFSNMIGVYRCSLSNTLCVDNTNHNECVYTNLNNSNVCQNSPNDIACKKRGAERYWCDKCNTYK